jgi:sugar lactone lactonase YvrE
MQITRRHVLGAAERCANPTFGGVYRNRLFIARAIRSIRFT